VSLLLLILLILAAFLPCRAQGAGKVNIVEHLVSEAREKHLAQDRYWNILLHYQKHLFGVESQINDPAFFLAKNGKTDPKSELTATIRTLFQPDTRVAQPYICKFYARFTWLKKTLHIDPALFADRTCPEVEKISPRAAGLIFPTYYMNNPASMFGHTLLTIDTGYSNKRLSNAVNYAAYVEKTNGVSFAMSGLFGLYKGYYSVAPYYKKIREYGDINQRDIWEFPLNLTPDEIKRMLRHLKELEQISTNYYFFDENCSYSLMFLLEAARPSVHLTDRFPLWVIPIDTIKAVGSAGMIEAPAFRPAKATRIKYEISKMDDSGLAKTRAVIQGKLTPEDLLNNPSEREEKIRILDLAIDEIQYLFVSESISKSAYKKQLMGALKARSRLGKSNESIDEKIPAPPRPDKGHGSSRISIAPGVYGGNVFLETRFRPAFTDLTDMDYITKQGAQIEFGDTRFRYYPEDRRFELQRFDIVNIVSISGRDAFFKPFSWEFNTGLRRKEMRDGQNGLYYRINAGGGVAVQWKWVGLCYFMPQAEADVAGRLEDNFALGGGAGAGVIRLFTPFLKSHLSGQIMRFGPGDAHLEILASLVNTFKISQNNHLTLELKWENTRHKKDFTGLVAWHFFFPAFY